MMIAHTDTMNKRIAIPKDCIILNIPLSLFYDFKIKNNEENGRVIYETALL